MSEGSQIRASDAERELIVGELREHLVAGRLSSEEFEDRVGRAYRAPRQADLEALKDDLPVSPATVQVELARRRGRLRRRLLQEAGGGLGISALCTVIWVSDGASGSFWPIWVIVGMLLPLIRDGSRLLGPDPDVEAVEARLHARRHRHLTHERRRRHRSRGPGLPPPQSR